ncbi:hypothetical protein METBIDRAFT_29562 [Metschnikowia bicuspidata var. bicuspidata NRRL YB-4993]|uniref:Uncharacterized protein n=1 Tax=Metschnikowia bicuspidata var. bicuspidata NRRL YB-4993 TaxID=869754 RepID=A0A1A0HGN9_9ASCO|nr:hypothetical protein METBIDRAFT_29562 [Metschnikowia bicuspidata var. bicuspidata NRRL YB-4993]OBA23018.1 hypothetical protein METBIDRAFT_29562 [Metschnikowia bicuspidata var. bicuspidata NRRL YB-4993]
MIKSTEALAKFSFDSYSPPRQAEKDTSFSVQYNHNCDACLIHLKASKASAHSKENEAARETPIVILIDL